MTLFELMAKISLDSSQYEKGIKDANKSAKGAQEQNETLVNKIKVLQSQYQSAGKRVEELTKKFNESVKKTGESSDETQKLAKELQKAESKVNSTQKAIDRYNKELQEAERAAEEAEKALDKYNDELGETEKKSEDVAKSTEKVSNGFGKGLVKAIGVTVKAFAGIAAGISAAGGALLAVAESTREYRNEMAKLDTAFTTMGHSSEAAYGAYSDLQSVLGESDQAVEAASHLAKLTDNEKDLEKWTHTLTGVYATFGASLPIEGLTEAANETAKVGQVTGPLADALNWAGVSEDAFNESLAACNSEQERQTLIMETLNGLYDDAAMAYKENNSAVIDANKATEKWNASLAKIGGAIEPLITMVKTLAADALGQLAPMVENVAKAFQEGAPQGAQAFGEMLGGLVNTIVEYAPKVVDMAVTLVESLVQGLSDNQESIAMGAVQIITTLATGILNMLPQIIQLGLDLIVSLALGIANSLPTLIPTIIDVVLKIVETLTNQETLTQLLGAAFTIITELAWGLIDNIDKLLDSVFLLIDGMIDFLLRPANLAMLIETAIELVLAIGTGIIKAIPQLLVSVATLIGSIFTNFFTADWGSIGTNLVDGLKNGISNAWNNLVDWFEGLFDDLIGIAKKILGIASPSKVFKKLGFFTADGFGIGFEDEFANVKDDMEDALNFDDASVGINASIRKVGAGAAGGAFGGVSYGDINIYVNGDKYHDENALAEALALKLQGMTDRRAAVFANG